MCINCGNKYTNSSPCGCNSPVSAEEFNAMKCEINALNNRDDLIEHRLEIIELDEGGDISDLLATKVDKVQGKQLSSNDFTNAYKEQLDEIAGGGFDGYSQLSITELRSLEAEDTPEFAYIIDKGREGYFSLDASDNTTADNDGTIIVTATGKRYKRIFDGPILVSWFGAKEDGTTLNTSFLNAALSAAASRMDKRVAFGRGTYISGPLNTIESGVSLIGAESRTKIIKTATRGHLFDTKADDVLIKNFDIDCNSSLLDGGVWVTGKRNIVDNVIVRNADAYSICIEGNWSDGTQFIAYPTEDNLVRNCQVYGQKRYHEIGGKSPIIAGGKAKRTRFENCLVEDSNGDYYDSDDAPGTVFINCKAKKNGVQSAYAAFWTEGEQTDNRHDVYIINCEADNFSIGIGTSERVELFVSGLNIIKNCKNGVRGINNLFPPIISGVYTYNCGNGFASSDIDGVFAFADGVTLTNCHTISSQALQSFVNYNPGGGRPNPVLIDHCTFDKRVRASYEDGGSRDITISNSIIKAHLIWYNGFNTKVRAINVNFNGGGVIGARIKSAALQNCAFKSTNNTQDAITMQLDQFNTRVDGCTFDGYNSVGANVAIGLGNRYYSLTNTPSGGEEGFVRGNSNTRSTYVGTANAEFKTGTLITGGAPHNTGMPNDPNGFNIWYIQNMHEENGNTQINGNYWSAQWAMPLTGNSIYTRYHHSTNNEWSPWVRLHDNTWFPVVLNNPETNQVLRFDGTNFVNSGFNLRNLSNVKEGSNIPDMPSIPSNGTTTFTITVVGATTGSAISLAPPSTIEAGLIWSGYVSAANTVTVRVHNTTGASIDPSPAEWKAIVINF